jgi:hypothetical protein
MRSRQAHNLKAKNQTSRFKSSRRNQLKLRNPGPSRRSFAFEGNSDRRIALSSMPVIPAGSATFIERRPSASLGAWAAALLGHPFHDRLHWSVRHPRQCGGMNLDAVVNVSDENWRAWGIDVYVMRTLPHLRETKQTGQRQ